MDALLLSEKFNLCYVLCMLNDLVHCVLLPRFHVRLENIVHLIADQLDPEMVQLSHNISEIFLLVAEILPSRLFKSILLPSIHGLHQLFLDSVIE